MDLTLRLISLIALDKFGDFVSDQVLEPTYRFLRFLNNYGAYVKLRHCCTVRHGMARYGLLCGAVQCVAVQITVRCASVRYSVMHYRYCVVGNCT